MSARQTWALDGLDIRIVLTMRGLESPSRVRDIVEAMHGSILTNSELARHTHMVRYHLGHLQEVDVVYEDTRLGVSVYGLTDRCTVNGSGVSFSMDLVDWSLPVSVTVSEKSSPTTG